MAEPGLEQLADRPLDQRRPEIVGYLATKITSPGERFGERRGDHRREPAEIALQLHPGLELGRPAGQVGERLTGTRTFRPLDQKTRSADRRVGLHPPGPQLEPEAEVVDDQLGQQRDQIGEPREPGRDAGEDRGAGHRPAERGARLQHGDAATRPSQIGRRHQAVVTTTDDDHRRTGWAHRRPTVALQRASSSALSTRSAALAESMIDSARRAPGMGIRCSLSDSSQASTTCCGLTP